MVSERRTDGQICAALIEKYEARILSLPVGGRGQWLIWTPVAALVTGAVAVALFVRKSLRRRAQAGIACRRSPMQNSDWPSHG
jgi:cytochrome c-type biogenesis protein CcmH/NrfF